MNVPPLSELPEGYMPFPGKKDKGGWLNYINELNREPKLSIMKSLTMVSDWIINRSFIYLYPDIGFNIDDVFARECKRRRNLSR